MMKEKDPEVYVKCGECGTLKQVLHLEWDLLVCPKCGAELANVLKPETEVLLAHNANKAVYYWE